MIVRLTNAECRAAAHVGLDRRLGALAASTHEVYGRAANGAYWEIDIEAAAGEVAVAKAFGVFYSAADTVAEDRLGDVAPGVQVRHTKRNDGSLICHDRDADDHRFVLVTGAMPTFNVVGWILGAEAKAQEFWRTNVPRPAFFVPQRALTPLA